MRDDASSERASEEKASPEMPSARVCVDVYCMDGLTRDPIRLRRGKLRGGGWREWREWKAHWGGERSEKRGLCKWGLCLVEGKNEKQNVVFGTSHASFPVTHFLTHSYTCSRQKAAPSLTRRSLAASSVVHAHFERVKGRQPWPHIHKPRLPQHKLI